MPPPPDARPSNASPYQKIEKQVYEKQIQTFGLYGHDHAKLRLRNGDTVEEGDCVEVRPGKDHSATSYSGERWVVEILKIKGEDKTSGNMEANLQKYRPTVGNLNELALSNHQQIIPADTVIRKVTVRLFEEHEPEQILIGKHELYYRYNFRVGNGPMGNRLVLARNQTLPPARCAVEKCKYGRYNPDEKIQRFCPRASCRLWYHNQCLEDFGFERLDRWSRRKHRLQAMLTGTDDFLYDRDDARREIPEVPATCYQWFDAAVKEQVAGVFERHFPRYEKGSICNIVWCAQTPIGRGCKYGVVGNFKIVAEARKILREIWDDRHAEMWPTDEKVLEFAAYNTAPKQRLFACMGCSLTI
ncbi:hypothetical protein FRC07_005173 [Ceratobasidium sp. 392]|nr:hypothetical protein FRC07_005173 [Ceratobasidium sp. 392]